MEIRKSPALNRRPFAPVQSTITPMFWPWLLKYSSFLITGLVALAVGIILDRLRARRADLIFYYSHPQWVTLPAQPGQQQMPAVGTFTLFLWNQGKAPAREVHIGHTWLPASNVFPDIPREIRQTPGGTYALRFPTFPARTLVSISYLYFGPLTVDQIISYVGSEDGTAKHIPVMLQRIWPKWIFRGSQVMFVLGLWVAVNFVWTLIQFLWRVYYKP